MILNKHILPSWQTFLENTSSNRPYGLCGRRTLPKYTGIPGINPEPPYVTYESGTTAPGWCSGCAYEALKVCQQVLSNRDLDICLRVLYTDAANSLSASLSVH